jgi:hypothetical protein
MRLSSLLPSVLLTLVFSASAIATGCVAGSDPARGAGGASADKSAADDENVASADEDLLITCGSLNQRCCPGDYCNVGLCDPSTFKCQFNPISCGHLGQVCCFDQCIQGVCKPTGRCGSQVVTTGSGAGGAGGGGSGGCTTDFDCPAGEGCFNGTCSSLGTGCTSDFDCLAGNVCVGGVCQAPIGGGTGNGCVLDVDCPGTSVCRHGVCCNVDFGDPGNNLCPLFE